MSVYLDTSALAKLYVNEPSSEAFATYFASVEAPWVSTLVVVEIRSLLARLQRAGAIDSDYARDAFEMLCSDLERDRPRRCEIRDRDVRSAAHLIARLGNLPLRTLDALHLAVCEARGFRTLATADGRMARAAAALGLQIDRF